MSENEEGASQKRLWVRLTRYCNQRCIFCLDRSAQTGGVVPLESVRRSLMLGRKQGLRRVVLSGGEATVHPEFIAIVELAREAGYTHIQTITNGRRFCYPDFLKKAVAAGLKEATFSLHGHTSALHDRLTRAPGSFVQAVSALRAALATPGLIVSVDVVINKLNLPVLREHLEFCIALGVGEFDLLALVPFGDAWKNRAELHCDFSRPENLAHLHRALELSRRSDLHLWTNRLRPEHLAGFESLIQPPAKILDEVRGRRRIFARYLNGGRRPSCSGESCVHCFLREFCLDLDLIVKDARLPAKSGPLCLRPATKAESFRFGAKPDIFAFARFYIESRYFLKAPQCGGCAAAPSCGGMSVLEIREKGFAAMTPVKRTPARRVGG
ncbi:MAG: radical SAM protein [Elusimicrobiota bacterium]